MRETVQGHEPRMRPQASHLQGAHTMWAFICYLCLYFYMKSCLQLCTWGMVFGLVLLSWPTSHTLYEVVLLTPVTVPA